MGVHLIKNIYNLLICFFITTSLQASSEKIHITEQDLMIQEMQSDDIEKIKKLFEKSPDIGSYTNASSDFSGYLNQSSIYKVYLCKNKVNGDLYGFLLAINYKDSFYVRALGVDKDYRRFGIATKLLKAAYEFAQQEKLPKITIQASNDKAKNCYIKFGFKHDSLTGCLAILLQ